MSYYFDQAEGAISTASRTAATEDEFLEAVIAKETEVVNEITQIAADREFPAEFRECFKQLCVGWLVRPRSDPEHNRGRDYALCVRASRLLAELHSLFHRVASSRTKTRFGYLSDDPASDLRCLAAKTGRRKVVC